MKMIDKFETYLFNVSENTRRAYMTDLYTVIREEFYHFWDFPKRYNSIFTRLKESDPMGTKLIPHLESVSIEDILDGCISLVPVKNEPRRMINRRDHEIIRYALSNSTDNLFWPELLSRDRIVRVMNHFTVEHGCKVNTIRRKMAALNTFEDFLYMTNIIPRKEICHIRQPRKEYTEPRPLTQDQIQTLLNLPESMGKRYWLRDKALLELMYGTGLRVSEISGIKLSDINLDAGIIHVHLKGNKHRTKMIPNETLKYLKGYIRKRDSQHNKTQNGNNYLFPGRRGPLTTRTIFRYVKAYGKELGVNIGPHVLRASIATHIIENGGDVYHVQNQLDHARLMTSEHYVKVGRKKRDTMKYHPKHNPI